MFYCGLCREIVEDWDKHEVNPDHINRVKEFFTDEAKGIELIRSHMHISNISAHVIYLILKGEYANGNTIPCKRS